MSRVRLLCILALAVLLAPTAAAAVPNLTAVPVATGIYQPTGVFFAPGDRSRMFITEQWTRNVVLYKDGVRQATPFLTLPAVADNSVGNEIGLLSIAFDPDYASNGYVYVDYNPPPQTISGNQYFTVKLVRYTRSAGNPDVVDPNSAVDIISVTKQAQNHNGSLIGFNPRDLADPVKRHYLYIGYGDGGGGGDGGPGHAAIGNAQSTRTLLGKILRIDVDPAAHPGGGYGIPADNPTLPVSTDDGLSGPSLREIFILGVRNPWRASFDRATGDLYIGDVGDTQREEIDILPYGQQAGVNLGWAIREADVAGSRPTVVPVVTPLRDPAFAYQRGAAIGGFVYRGSAIPGLAGTYLFADYGGSGTMYRCTPDAAGNTVGDVFANLKQQLETALGHGLGGNVSSWGQDEDGELYFCTHNGNPGTATSVYLLRADNALTPPVFGNAPVASATAGFAWRWDFTVTGNPAPTLALEQAPAGMVLSGNALVWSDPVLGDWDVRLRATNGQAPDAVQAFTLHVAGLRSGDPVAASDLEDGLWVSRYLGAYNLLPDFDGLSAMDCIRTDAIAVNAATKASADGNNYALRFTGFLNITNPGVYQFYLTSDDGSRLRIGDKVVVDNDGGHGSITRTGSIGLDIGFHAFTVEYFQGGGGANVDLQWAPPGGSQMAIPVGWIKRWIQPPGVDVAARVGPYLDGRMPNSILGALPATLSQTGAFRDLVNLIPATGVMPYDVNTALWSDGAGKGRWIAVPSGTSIAFSEAGNWTFPVGTVLVKHFAYGAKRLETRLLVVTPTGAYGVTYHWRADNSDADLVASGGLDETVTTADGDKPWHYPSQSECMQCHTAAAGYVIGPRTDQLNKLTAYASTGRSADQLRTFAANGLLSGWDPAQAAGYAKLYNVSDASATLEQRARSYLAANCAMCHQPGGPTPAIMDFRFHVPDAQGHAVVPAANYIGVAPSDTLGIAGAKIVDPGSVATSVLYQRIISVTPSVRMPPLARTTVDTTGTPVVGQWINALGGGGGNLPPTATASPTALSLALPANQATLTGGGSDPEGQALTFAWSVASGTAADVAFATPTAASTQVTFAAAGSWTLRLTVTDSQGASGSADVQATVAPASAWSTVTAIDCGKATGTPITADGITWALDPTLAADRVEGPADFAGTTTLDAIYQTNQTGGDFTYTFTGLAAGTYRARVLTTEVYFTQAGSRVFNVAANGATVASGIDPFALGGGRFVASEADTATFSPDANGTVALRFQASVDAALVTALVLERQGAAANQPPTASATPTTVALTLPTDQATLVGGGSDPEAGVLTYAWSVVAGTAADVAFATPAAATTTVTFAAAGSWTLRLTVTDDHGATATADVTATVAAAGGWSTVTAIDCGQVTGTPITADGITWALDPTMAGDRVEGPADFAGTTTLDAIYRTNQTGGDFTYSFTGLAAGTYRARVLTTEVWFTQAGSRVFNVSANGTVVATGIDPFALAGAQFTASEADTASFSPDANGTVALRFQSTADAALVTGLVLERQGGATNQPPTASVTPTAVALTLPADQATLVGGGSDPEAGVLTYAWSVAAGTEADVAFATPAAATTTVTFAAAGSWTLRLTVTDDHGATATADVTATVASGGGWSTVTAIDCGQVTGPPITADGITWALDPTMAADRVEGPADFAGTTTLDAIYRTNRTGGDFTYTFTGLAAGTYRARVLTTEVYFTQAGSRVFNVAANGAAVATGVDPFALGGAKFTASEVATATFSPDVNGTVALRFQSTVDAALVTALVLEVQGGAANQPPTATAAADATSLTLPDDQVALTGTAADPDGSVTATAWSVSAGSAADVVFADPAALGTTATFAAAGVYTLRLTVTDDLGATAYGEVQVTVTDPNAVGSIQINFQPADGNVPGGWLADTGGAYGDRGNGQTYGWSVAGTPTGIAGDARRRNAANSPDVQHDTLIHMAKVNPAAVWEIAVPAGTYDVDLVCGDPGYTDMVDNLLVEGVAQRDPDGQDHWDEFLVRVSVADGRLTVAMAADGANAKLDAISITPVPIAPQ